MKSTDLLATNLHTGFFEVVVVLIGVGWLTGRLLGVRRGFFRAVAAGLVGLVAGQLLLATQFGWDESLDSPSDLLTHGLGLVGYMLLVTMVASVAIEMIFRPRKERPFWIPRPIKWIKTKLAQASRIVDVVAIARRHGLVGRKRLSRATIATPAGANALRLTLEDCGGIFIKFGQIAAGRDDVLPPALTAELSQLRTAAKPLPINSVIAVINAELGADYMNYFESFDQTPLASASIAVTHRAKLKSGLAVVVKVQRPTVDEGVRRDCAVLLWAARRIERSSPTARSFGIVDLAEELVDSVTSELDFRREAANNAAMRRNKSGEVRIPEVDRELTTERVLVMEEVAGKPISDSDAVDQCGIARDVLADRLFKSFLDQVLEDGVFHADPHAGNVMIDRDGVLWFVDFGAVGLLDPVTLEALQQMAIGFTLRDPGILARAVRRMSGGAVELDIPALEFDLGKLFTSVEDIGFGPASISEIIQVMQRHQVPAPKALSILARAAVTIEGTLRTLSPGYDMSGATDRLVDRFPPVESAKHSVSDEILRALPTLRTLPETIGDIAAQARAGQLTVRVDRYGGGDRAQIDQWLDRILWSLSSLTGLVVSAILLLAAGVTENADAALYLRAIGFVGLVAASAMQLRVIARLLDRVRNAPER